jgi:uncharacterized protein YjiS (DUF1127 family)
MEKVREFQDRARECQELAAAKSREIRGNFANLARIWEKLAQKRRTFFVEEPKGATG